MLKSVTVVRTYSTGLEILIILPSAPVIEPTILSPLVNEPVIVPSVKDGIVTSVLTSSESRTATNLNTSALPKEIVLSVGRVPNASVSPGLTANFFISWTVLFFWLTLVFNIVAINLTFVPVGRFVASVIVIAVVPDPAIVEAIDTISPWLAPPLAVRIDKV